MKKYLLVCNMKGRNYRFNDDKNTKTIKNVFDSVDEICEWLIKNSRYDDGHAIYHIVDFNVYQTNLVFSDWKTLFQNKESDKRPCDMPKQFSCNEGCDFYKFCH